MALIDQNDEHLKILSICYVAWAAWSGAMTLLMLPFLGLMAFVMSKPELFANNRGAPPPPEWIGTIMVVVAIFAAAMGIAMTAFSYFCGRFLRERRHRMFCMIVAVLNCFSVPFGTLLGVFTIVVLERDEVRAAFAQKSEIT